MLMACSPTRCRANEVGYTDIEIVTRYQEIRTQSDCNAKMINLYSYMSNQHACGHGDHRMMPRSITINTVRDGTASVRRRRYTIQYNTIQYNTRYV